MYNGNKLGKQMNCVVTEDGSVEKHWIDSLGSDLRRRPVYV